MAGKRTWTVADDAVLGTITDAEAAKLLGRKTNTVAQRRIRKNIPSFARTNGGQRAWTEEEISLLGTMSDSDLAKKIGRTDTAVASRRDSYGIPGYSANKMPAARIPAWQEVEMLDQHTFFRTITKNLSEYLGTKFTLGMLANATYLSESRMQKWSAPGAGQEPLTAANRHHIWLAAKHIRKRDYGLDQKTILGK